MNNVCYKCYYDFNFVNLFMLEFGVEKFKTYEEIENVLLVCKLVITPALNLFICFGIEYSIEMSHHCCQIS